MCIETGAQKTGQCGADRTFLWCTVHRSLPQCNVTGFSSVGAAAAAMRAEGEEEGRGGAQLMQRFSQNFQKFSQKIFLWKIFWAGNSNVFFFFYLENLFFRQKIFCGNFQNQTKKKILGAKFKISK